MKYGYKVEIIKIYQFTKAKLFNEYIDHFYSKKKNATGAERFIVKLHLNSLYARKLDILKTVTVASNQIKRH